MILFCYSVWRIEHKGWLVFFYFAKSLREGHNPANPNPEGIPSTQYNVTLPDPPTTNNFKLNLKIRGTPYQGSLCMKRLLFLKCLTIIIMLITRKMFNGSKIKIVKTLILPIEMYTF